MKLGKQSRGDNKKISEYFKGHPPSSPGRQSGTKSPSPVHQQQQQPMQNQQQSFMGVPNVVPSPQGAATTTTSAAAITASSAAPSTTASSYPNSNMNHSAPSGAFLSHLLHHLDHLLSRIYLLPSFGLLFLFLTFVFGSFFSLFLLSRLWKFSNRILLPSIRWHSSQQYGDGGDWKRHAWRIWCWATTVSSSPVSDSHRCPGDQWIESAYCCRWWSSSSFHACRWSWIRCWIDATTSKSGTFYTPQESGWCCCRINGCHRNGSCRLCWPGRHQQW